MFITEKEIHYFQDDTAVIQTECKQEPYYIIIDKEDVSRVINKSVWIIHIGKVRKNPYAYISLGTQKETYSLHTYILGDNKPKKGFTVDHKFNDTLDNRKSMLRICTRGQNNKNKPKVVNSKYTSKYKGVSWDKLVNKWRAEIKTNGIRRYIGIYKNESDAAIAYNEKAIKYHKEYASINKL